MATTYNSPDSSKRPKLSPEDFLKQQKNERSRKAAANKKKSDTAKTSRQLETSKEIEANIKIQMITANKEFATANKAYDDAVKAGANSGTLEILAKEVVAKRKLKDDYMAAYTDAYSRRIALERSLEQVYVAAPKTILNKFKKSKNTKNKDKGISNASIEDGANNPTPPIYYYNAPMIKTAYFKVDSTQDQYSTIAIDNPGNFTSGLEAWDNALGAKGVIQMDSKKALSYANSVNADNSNLDKNLYGFKFLYNPKEVSMTWGVAEGLNWEGVAANMDPFSPITLGLKYSTINFSLLLNRIGDMAVINAYGLKEGVGQPYPLFDTPNNDPNKEFAEIYKKGTMYDMEYLFRTIKGFNSKRTNRFNIETSDVGWLQGTQVELHLGDGLRYLVRINSLDINHAMFNDRMVPILSYVNISCSRFNDLS